MNKDGELIVGRIVHSFVMEDLDISTNDREFPPFIQNGIVYYHNVVSIQKNPEKTTPAGISFATAKMQQQTDIFGPFRIGTIEPGKSAEIEIHF